MSDKINAQFEFGEWVKDWINQSSGCGPKEKVIQPDILDIMAIFKILGFETVRTEVINPKDVATLKDSGNGIKIVLSCTTSGIRSIMELKTSCKCPKYLVDPTIWINNDSNKELGNYTLNNNEVNELIAVPSETDIVIQSITNHFLHLIQNNDQNANSTQNKSPSMQLETVTSKSNILTKQNTFSNIDNYNLTVKITSPVKYRSLDTLTGDLSISEIPEPGKLRRNESNHNNMQLVSSSSPNISQIRGLSTSSPSQTCEPNLLGYTKLLTAQSLINEVLGIMENKQNAAKLNFDISRIKGSSDCLLDEQVKLQETTPKTLDVPKVSMKPKCRAPIRSTGSLLKPDVIKNPITRPVSKSTSSASAIKSLENVSFQKTPKIKPNPKYMHIKSTISKTKTVTLTKK